MINNRDLMCPKNSCNATEDAQRIERALKGIANDEGLLVEIIARRSNLHMQKVREEFEKLYQRDLISKIKQDVKMNIKHFLVALIKSNAEYKSDLIFTSLKESKRFESEPFVNFIFGNDNRELEETKHYFRTRYSMSLIEFMQQYTRGKFKRIVVKALEAKRGVGVEEDKIENDVELLSIGSKSFGMDEVMNIFVYRSHEHLLKVLERYKERFNIPLQNVIMNQTKSFYRSALFACIDPPQIYWAKRIYQAFKDLEKSDCLLVCCFTQCSKPFLHIISEVYQQLFDISLIDEIKKNTSGCYQQLLLTLLDLPQTEKFNYGGVEIIIEN